MRNDVTVPGPAQDDERPKRRPLSKRLRIEIFKRDHFACVYCGRTPPEVVLQVDHFEPVAGGGSDDPSNLFTACADCNLGKSDKRIENALPQIRPEEIDELAERVEQMQAYQHWRSEFERRLRLELNAIYGAWVDELGGRIVEEEDGSTTYSPNITFPSEKMLLEYLEQLPTTEILDAVRSTGWRYQKRDRDPIESWALPRYFYAICKRKIKARDEDRQQIEVSWPQLIEAIPELETIRAEVEDFFPSDPWHFCGEVLWKGGWQIRSPDGTFQSVPAPLTRISGLVGPKSENSRDRIFGSIRAQDLAIRTIRADLPACGQTCSCGRPKQPPRERDYPRCRACGQATEPVDRRESCIETVTEWQGHTFYAVPYGREPWLNLVTIAENYYRWHRLATPRSPVIAARCSGCRTPIEGFHHPGCGQRACPVCGERATGDCASRDHLAKPMDITPRRLAAQLRRRTARLAAQKTVAVTALEAS